MNAFGFLFAKYLHHTDNILLSFHLQRINLFFLQLIKSKFNTKSKTILSSLVGQQFKANPIFLSCIITSFIHKFFFFLNIAKVKRRKYLQMIQNL